MSCAHAQCIALVCELTYLMRSGTNLDLNLFLVFAAVKSLPLFILMPEKLTHYRNLLLCCKYVEYLFVLWGYSGVLAPSQNVSLLHPEVSKIFNFDQENISI